MKNKFRNDELLSVLIYPVIFAQNIILNSDIYEDRELSNKYFQASFDELYNEEYYKSELMNFIIHESVTHKDQIMKYIQSIESFDEEFQKSSAIINRKITDSKIRDFSADMLAYIYFIGLSMGAFEKDIEEYLIPIAGRLITKLIE